MRLPTVFALSALAGVAAADPSLVASCDALGYAGTIALYDSLADATAGTNARFGPVAVAQRDAEVFVVHDRAAFSQDISVFLTTIDYTVAANANGLPKDDSLGDNYYSGLGNPNRTVDSFVQIYDSEAHGTASVAGGWTSAAYDTFDLDATGFDTLSAADDEFHRLWNAGRPDAGFDALAGGFLTWNLHLRATGLQGTDADGDGFVEATNVPTGITGALSGIFENRNLLDPASHGFYRFDLTLNATNWAVAQGDAALNGNLRAGRFGAQAVPEPASMLALAAGVGALLRRRPRR